LAVRSETDPIKKAALKKLLPAATISGTFTQRNVKGLVKHSGFICLDLDRKDNNHISQSEWNTLKDRLKEVENISYMGLSCSGTGYFILIPIAFPEKHKQHFEYLRNAFLSLGIIIDKSCSDVSRLRFASYDPEPYINENAEVLTVFYIEPQKPVYIANTNTFNSADILTREANKVLNAPDGQKYYTLNKAGYTLGGFVGAGLISEVEAVAALETAINSCDCKDYNEAYKTIQKSISHGQLKPIRQ
jgi:hypothetical protein